MKPDRREFLKRLAKGSLYAAPLIHSLAAPEGLAAGGGGTGKVMGMGGMGMQTTETLGTSGFGTQAPWSRPPPGGGG